MTSQVKLVQLGVWSAEAAAAAGGDLANNIALSAANSTTFTASGSGTVQTSTVANAGSQLYQIIADLSIFTTVGATFNSAQLTNQGSAYIVVFNNGASTLLVFPPLGGTINAQAANLAFGVGAGKSTTFLTTDGNTWVAQHAG